MHEEAGWQRAPLESLATLVMGQSPPSASISFTGAGLPFIQGNAEFGFSYPKPQKVCSDPIRIAETGDVLISVRAPVGSLNRAHIRLCIGRGLAALRFEKLIAPEFGWYAMQGAVGDLVALAQGSTFQAVGKPSLGTLALPVPPLKDQRAIAAILQSVDSSIDTTRIVIEQLQVVKEAMLVELLSRGIPGRHNRFRTSGLGDVPEDWEQLTLEELGFPGEQVVRSGPFGSSMKTKDFRSTGTPVLTIQSLGEGGLRREGLFFVDDEKAAELSEYRLRGGDLVFSRVADIGRSVAIDDTSNGWLISPNLMRIRLDPARMNARFVMYAITLGRIARRQIEEIAGNAGRQVVSSTFLKRISLLVPPLAEQAEIARLGQQIEKRLSSEVALLEALTLLKSVLLPALLSGEIRVTPDEAPA